MTKTTPWTLEPSVSPAGSRARSTAAAVLHGASGLLTRVATWLHVAEPGPAPEPVFEFYAEAGAPEGALYVDGARVGVLPGVTRL